MTDMSRTIFSGMQILFQQKFVKDQALVIENNSIRAIIPAEMIAHHLPAKHYQFPSDYYLIPGMIDLHIHGAHGKDVMDGTDEALHAISQSLVLEGVTGFLATTMTADNAAIETVLKLIPNAMQSEKGAALLGVHLEGPFIAKEKMGAQAESAIQLPNSQLLKSWQALANGAIKLVTLAPELKGALEFIHDLRRLNIIAAIGHTNATYDETNAAIAAGCTQATHLFNAMRGLHQREPGAVGALLLSDQISAELIVDDWHLHPAIVKIIYELKGRDRLLLVTDAMRAKCMRNGHYTLGNQEVTVTEGKATLMDGTLAGSTLTMPKAIKNMQQFTNCSLPDAILMATHNPAFVLGIDHKKGTIDLGKDADVVIMNAALEVQMTVRAGNVVYLNDPHAALIK